MLRPSVKDIPGPYRRGSGRGKKVFAFLLLAALVGLGFWKGEVWYYRFFGDKLQRLSRYIETFEYRYTNPGHTMRNVWEPLKRGLEFTGRLLESDPANPELQYYRAYFQYLLARWEMDLDEARVLAFAARPDTFSVTANVERFLRNCRVATRKAVALGLEPEHRLYPVNEYLRGFCYLFSGPVLRPRAWSYFARFRESPDALAGALSPGPGDDKNTRRVFLEPHWPVGLAALFAGQGAPAADAFSRSDFFTLPHSRPFLKALTLFQEKRYTESLDEFSALIREIRPVAGSRGNEESPGPGGALPGKNNTPVRKNFILIESYRHRADIYRTQNLAGRARENLKRAFTLDPDDPFMKKIVLKKGLAEKTDQTP